MLIQAANERTWKDNDPFLKGSKKEVSNKKANEAAKSMEGREKGIAGNIPVGGICGKNGVFGNERKCNAIKNRCDCYRKKWGGSVIGGQLP